MSENDSRDDNISAVAERATEVASATAEAASGTQQLASDLAAAAAGPASSAAGTATAVASAQAQQAQQAMGAAGQAASSAQQLQHDPVGGLLGLVGGGAGMVGAVKPHVAQAASMVSQAADAAQQAAGTAQQAARGTSSTARVSTSSEGADAARAHGNIGPAPRGAWPVGDTQRHDISMTVEIGGLDDVLLGVRAAHLEESVSSVPHATIDMRCDGDLPETRALLGVECAVQIARDVEMRSFRGIVHEVHVTETPDGTILTVEVAPALSLLRWIVDSRIYQEKTVLEVVEQIYLEKLEGKGRTMRNECQRTYERHEYLVQYNESCLAFIQRLLELEGIFYYFDHDQDGGHEVLVLADTGTVCPQIRPADRGRVPFAADPEQAPDHEAIMAVEHTERVGITDVVTSGHDWTNPRASVRAERLGRADGQPALEYHEHIDGVSYHQYDGTKYAKNTAAEHATVTTAVLDRMRMSWRMQGTVVSAQPGRRIMSIVGAPDGMDEPYLIVHTQTHVEATEGATGSLIQSLQCVPTRIPYHPARRTPTPIVHGLESAIVVGEDGDEIHTDQHRRIRIQFHWDRLGERNQHSSCYIRVAQMWAGEGWGTLFLPRVGMEVIVSFLGGHPHRPVVIGSLYNGVNTPPYTSDEDITKSTIKTNSSPGGDGYNELRFEDAAGSEEIFIHAQKDMNEVIENNHSTSVGGNQTNSVSGNRTHSVDKNETITVTGSQKITISGKETGDGQEIQGAQLDIDGEYKLDASDKIMVQAPNKVRIDVGSTYIEMTPSQIKLHCGGSTLILESAQAELKSNGNSVVRLNADAKVVSSGAAEIYLNAHGKMSSAAGSNVHLEGANGKLVAASGGTVELTANAEMSGLEAKVAGALKAEMSGGTEAKVVGGAGSVTAAVSGVDVAGPQVNVTGQAMTNIAGAVVKIN